MEIYSFLVDFFGLNNDFTNLGDFLPYFLGFMVAVTLVLFIFGSISQMVRSVTR